MSCFTWWAALERDVACTMFHRVAHQAQERVLTAARQAWLPAAAGSLEMAGCWHICCREPRMDVLGLHAFPISQAMSYMFWSRYEDGFLLAVHFIPHKSFHCIPCCNTWLCRACTHPQPHKSF